MKLRILLVFLLGLTLAKADEPRERILFNNDWRFVKGDPADAGRSLDYAKFKPWILPSAAAFVSGSSAVRPPGRGPGETVSYAQPSSAFDDSAWRRLDLPHDWGIEGPFDPAIPAKTGKLPCFGVAWYRKTFDLPAADAGRRIVLEIDGAMSYSAVWCNGRFVGGWPYGYASYQLDLTSFLRPGSTNTLAIRLDNPDESSRWYPGGGLYRNVWLTKTAAVHVGQWGVRITTPEITSSTATLAVDSQIVNQSEGPASLQVVTQIFKADLQGRPSGAAILTSSPQSLSLGVGESKSAAIRLTLADPVLWDLVRPERYVAVTLVQQGDSLLDRVETPFGIRTAEFTANDGFHLNGQRVPLQGVCMHHDLGALGAAFNLRAAERQLEILKEMGVNAIRTAHNPPAPEFLDLCDRMGFLVIDELTDTWTVAKKPNGYAKLFADWSEADLRAMIRRDRNHPSVVMWSIGNEIGEQIQLKNHRLAARLSTIAREEDPARPTTAGCDQPPAGYNGFQKTIDVFGYNYKPHEYAKFRSANPAQPLYGSETASTVSSRGVYAFPVHKDKDHGRIGFHMSSYDLYAPNWASTPDTEFKGQDENPFVAGEFIWTGFDYLGEPTPFNHDFTILSNYHTPEDKAKAEAELKALGKIDVPSRSSYFGAVDLAGFKKDRFYLYQARWRPELPMAHILPHWNWPERTGEITPVHVYTSGDEAELWLNGQSLGRKKKDRSEYRLCWDDVRYSPGELKVVAYKAGQPWATEVVKTTGTATRLLLSVDRSTIATDGLDLGFVTASVVDDDGLVVPRSNPKLSFTISGPGEIVATDNGDPTDLTTFSSPERKAFNGLALAIVRAKPGSTGAITVRVTGEGVAPSVLTLNASSAAASTPESTVDLSRIPSPILFRGDATTAYRDPAVVYHGGIFRMFYSYIRIEEGKPYWFTAVSRSTNLIDWTPPRILTPKDLNLNFSSPGNVVRFGDEWVLCLQTYPRPNGEKYGNDTARLWTMRSRDLENWGEPELLKTKGPEVPVEQMGRMIDPFLLQDKDDPGKWWCFYKQNGLRRSWSRDLRTWTDAGRILGGENPCAVVQGNEYVMFYSPDNGIEVKRSDDLKTWRNPALITLGQKDWPWAKGRITAGFVMDLRSEKGIGKYLMVFHGSGPEDERTMFDDHCSLGIAWSDDLVHWDWPGKTNAATNGQIPIHPQISQ